MNTESPAAPFAPSFAARAVAFWRRHGAMGTLNHVGRRLYDNANRATMRRIKRWQAKRDVSGIRHHNDYFFAELGVTRDEVTALHREISATCGIAVRESESLHRYFFAALRRSGFDPSHILEIGTEHGETARYLAELFPGAEVTTVNLPADDPLYRLWHPEGVDRHDETLARYLDHPRIHALRVNTMWLERQDLPPFDLIWLDGGHEFPEVAWDHFYAMQHLAPGGWLFSDDITPPTSYRVRAHRPVGDPHRVIEYYNARLARPFRLLLKREVAWDPLADAKYIAFRRHD